MMKLFFLAAIAVTFSQAKCTKEKATANCYKGRLEVKGICSNYTIALVDGALDPSKLEASWTDETTGKSYKNVFALGSPCDFPADLNVGDEFYFTLDAQPQNCVVCQAFYPRPAKSIVIRVLDKPCR
jgi:hypothetical protein